MFVNTLPKTAKCTWNKLRMIYCFISAEISINSTSTIKTLLSDLISANYKSKMIVSDYRYKGVRKTINSTEKDKDKIYWAIFVSFKYTKQGEISPTTFS